MTDNRQPNQGAAPMSNLINTEVKPFKATAFHNGKFIDVTEADLKGKWSVVFFYPADFTFVCPTELGDLADNYDEFKKLGVEIYAVSTDKIGRASCRERLHMRSVR